jgi:hypothetical protein
MDREDIRIKAAAIKYKGEIYEGRRHVEIIERIWDLHGYTEIPEDDQGFVTNDSRFVNRWQAGAIAFDAGQTKTRHEKLISEHLVF